MTNFRRAKKRLSYRFLFSTTISLLSLGFIVISLLQFVKQIPTSASLDESTTDAIVVLTGGSDRLDEGLNLLSQKKAKKLFVSGVYRGVDVRRLLALSQGNPQELLCCIELGYAAISTKGNAAETKAWIDSEGYKSIRLVTANYHMPRSIKEFRHQMPKITIIPHSVFPKRFKRDEWWRWPGTANLILTEYIKYLMSSTRHLKERFAAK